MPFVGISKLHILFQMNFSKIYSNGKKVKVNLPASICSSPVAKIFPFDLFQHPATPVKNEMKMKKNPTIYIPITDRAISAKQERVYKINK